MTQKLVQLPESALPVFADELSLEDVTSYPPATAFPELDREPVTRLANLTLRVHTAIQTEAVLVMNTTITDQQLLAGNTKWAI